MKILKEFLCCVGLIFALFVIVILIWLVWPSERVFHPTEFRSCELSGSLSNTVNLLEDKVKVLDGLISKAKEPFMYKYQKERYLKEIRNGKIRLEELRKSKNPAYLMPKTRILYMALVNLAKREGIEVRFTHGLRSQRQQNYIYAQGRTREGKIVTMTKNSKHTKGKAFDVVVIIDGKPNYQSRYYNKLGALGEMIGLTWGGNWKMKDYGHFEI